MRVDAGKVSSSTKASYELVGADCPRRSQFRVRDANEHHEDHHPRRQDELLIEALGLNHDQVSHETLWAPVHAAMERDSIMKRETLA